MKINHESRFTSQQLTDQIKVNIEKLAHESDAARVSQEMLRYIEMSAKFHQYSWCNIWLIMAFYPHATQVAQGFRAWNKLNRFVRKGERGIPILAPILIKEENDENKPKSSLRGFKVVYVFDVSQTDGEPLPEPPDWKSPERDHLLQIRLLTFAKEQNISVIEKQLTGEIQGVSKGGVIELAPNAGTSTLIHELAHELMHQHHDAPLGRSIRELEAEAVAYIVGHHFGLKSAGSPNYMALHGLNSEMILKHLERVSSISAKMIGAIELTT